MKLLVTGSRGFTGRHFVAAARGQGYDISELTVDLTDREAVISQVADIAPDAVVHLAAISFVGHSNPLAFYHVNVIGTANLLDALALLKKPPRILLSSSANVYGNCEQSPITEAQLPMPVNHYATSKLAMECMAKTYLDRLPLFFVRPFNYIGVGQSEAFLIPKLVAHFLRRADTVELGNINVEREFNDVRVVCQAYLQLLAKAAVGDTYNICSGQPVALLEIINILAAMTGHGLQVKINPALVRQNEIHRLCGDPAKLQSVTDGLILSDLPETLAWMLGHFGASA